MGVRRPAAQRVSLPRRDRPEGKLGAGTRITISGWAATDSAVRAFSAGEVTFADGSTLLFGALTHGAGDTWRCLTEPCASYRYPDVPSN